MPSLSFNSPIGPLTIHEQRGAITSLSWERQTHRDASPLLIEAEKQVQEGSEDNIEDANKDSNENVQRHNTPSSKEQPPHRLENSVLLFSRSATNNAMNTSPVAMHRQNSVNEKHDWIGDVEHLNGEKEKYARNDVDDVYVTDDLFA